MLTMGIYFPLLAGVSVRQIIARCGGDEAVAKATAQTPWAVRKWRQNGIPERHWAVLRELGGMTAEELHAANEALRTGAPGAEAQP